MLYCGVVGLNTFLADYLKDTAPSAQAIIAIAIMLITGFLMTRLAKKLRLPNVTAYIVAGILIGPFCFNFVPTSIVKGMDFLPDVALAFIAFSTGEFFKFSTLKKNGVKVVVITLFEALAASLVVFILTFVVLRLDLAFSVVLAALASTTAPASTMMTIHQTGAKGDFVDTLLQVVALDDIVGLLAYSTAITVAVMSYTGGSFSFGGIAASIGKNLGVLLLGALFGVLMNFSVAKKTQDNRLIVAIALLFAFCGICTLMDISPLLGCMSMATVYFNLSEDEKLFMQLNYFSPPLLLLFFVRSGISFDLGALFSASGSIGSTPLIVIGILYFVVRILGKYLGAWIGCMLTGKEKKTRDFLGFALVPQAGVAIGLVALGARTLGGAEGEALQTIILASSVLYELIGPALAKMSLHLSGSYSDKLEDVVEVEEKTPTGQKKTSLELLIERIEKIQEEIPEHEINMNEEAFTEAAESYYENMMQPRFKRKTRRR
ncbi:MAG: cation:proton antiporter [Lachnospiraceae bacterium]|nr:cation:proton antiporter [Lachnospiraceae bacterium]MBR5733388.1 cation:proton antiporter [Lachnospiraceae bacterium]